jgi:long-subunit fatty acid transport protein
MSSTEGADHIGQERRMSRCRYDRMRITMRGDTRVDGRVVDEDMAMPWATPDTVKLGLAVSMLQDTLTLAAEFKYWMYSVSHTPEEAGMGYQWNDSIALALGAEYKLSGWIPLRMGWFGGRSATPESGASPLGPPPGANFGVTLGGGVRLGRFDLDLGAGYHWGSSAVERASTPGEYTFRAFFLSVSATFGMS